MPTQVTKEMWASILSTAFLCRPEGQLTGNKTGGRSAAPGLWQGLWCSAGAHIGLVLELAAQKRERSAARGAATRQWAPDPDITACRVPA